MANSDPHGIQEAMASMPTETRVPRVDRIRAGILMVNAGTPYRQAAEDCDVSATTLYRHAKYSNLMRMEREKQVRVLETSLIDKQFAIADLASEKIFERIAADTMRDGDLIKAQGVAIDKIAMKRQWSKGGEAGEGQEGLSALAKILQGKILTVTDADPAARAIDVTGKSLTDQ